MEKGKKYIEFFEFLAEYVMGKAADEAEDRLGTEGEGNAFIDFAIDMGEDAIIGTAATCLVKKISTIVASEAAMVALLKAAVPVAAGAAIIGTIASENAWWNNYKENLIDPSIRDYANEINKMINSQNAFRNDKADYLIEVGDEISTIQELIDGYYDLAGKTNSVRLEYGDLQLIAQRIIDKMPEAMKYYDEETGLIKAEKKAMEELIEVKRKNLLVGTLQDIKAKEVINRNDIQNELEEVTYKLNMNKYELLYSWLEIQNDISNGNGSANVSKQHEEYARLLNSRAELEETRELLQEALADTELEIEKYSNDSINGLNDSLKGGYYTTSKTAQLLALNIAKEIGVLPNEFFLTGQDSIWGGIEGITSVENLFYDKVGSLAKNTAEIMNSPFKAMGIKTNLDSLDPLAHLSYSVTDPTTWQYYKNATYNTPVMDTGLSEFLKDIPKYVPSTNPLIPNFEGVGQKENTSKEIIINLDSRTIAKASSAGQRARGKIIIMEK